MPESKKPRRKITPKVTATLKWDIEKRFNQPLKSLSTQIQNTKETDNKFYGYQMPVSKLFKDHLGRTWQFQARAVCVKSKYIKKDELKPMIAKWAIGVRVKAFLKYIIDWANK